MKPKMSWSVYPPREDTFLLLPFARSSPEERVADVGTGNGFLALTAARDGAYVVATDVNPVALRQLGAHAKEEALRLEPVRTDLLRGLTRFDRILANPPYLPTPQEGGEEDRGDRLALDGGEDGLSVTRRIFHSLPEHLAPRGRAYVLTSSLQEAHGLKEILANWRGQGGRVGPVATRQLEGERLEVLECRRADGTAGPRARTD